MKIVYNIETKTFGIQGSRVRKLGNDYIKSKYGEDSDEYKDRMERDQLLDEIAGSQVTNPTRPYGYASTPDQNLEIYNKDTYRNLVPQNYVNNPEVRGSQSVNYRNKELSPDQVNQSVNKLNDNFYNDMASRFILNRNRIGNKLYRLYNNDIQGNDLHNVIKNLVTKNGDEYDGNSDDSYMLPYLSGGYKVAIRPQASNSEAFHEYQHYLNRLNGESPEYSQRLEFSEWIPDGKSVMGKHRFSGKPLSDPNKILDYINTTSQEELSANRGGVMNSYIYGGDSYDGNDGKLESAQLLNSELSQAGYDSIVGGYRPPSNRYNMSPEAYNNLMMNLKNKQNP